MDLRINVFAQNHQMGTKIDKLFYNLLCYAYLIRMIPSGQMVVVNIKSVNDLMSMEKLTISLVYQA